MRIISLKLHNIRSYTDARLEFPEGIVMLSGDIGSGKSTTLISIEFALFGLLRGELSGNALLRTGAQQGSVELTFELEDKKYTIKRSLKRSKNSVEQSTGYLLVDGVKQEATATELKSKIIELLGYPQELLTKSKNFVYRYTVYTPQEDMKRIILESDEQRLGILRRVFDIDKYQRITQNASNYAKSLRERKRAMDIVVMDLNEKKKQLAEAEEELKKTNWEIEDIVPQLRIAKEQLEENKKQTAKIELQKQQAENLMQKYKLTETQIQLKEQQQKSIQQQIAQMRQQDKLPELPDSENIAQQHAKLNQHLIQSETELQQMTSTAAEIQTRKKYSEETAQKISNLDHCPTCLQDVTEEHKHSIIQTEKQKIDAYERKRTAHQAKVKETRETISRLKTEIEAIRKQQQEINLLKLRHQHALEAEKRRQALKEQHSRLTDEINNSRKQLVDTENEMKPLLEAKTAYQELLEKQNKLVQTERELSIRHSALMQKEQSGKNTFERLTEEIAKKEKSKEKLQKTQEIHNWLTDAFMPMMGIIEKHVMAKIHHEFDALFQQWFSMLVEDLMSARLNEAFTPIVQQNGYDIEIENLSGGERTACALAYRLALNKTINSLISNIKTKDLLILDEPTDGFSAEQLDKMREVLAQLKLKQIIIVSHEQKIEGFADEIIRVRKEEHVSRVD